MVNKHINKNVMSDGENSREKHKLRHDGREELAGWSRESHLETRVEDIEEVSHEDVWETVKQGLSYGQNSYGQNKEIQALKKFF